MIKKFEGFTGGGSGINLFGTPELTASLTPVRILGFELDFNNWLYYLSWTVALIGYVVAWLLLRGRTGRAFRAVRDSETAAVSSGVSLARTKVLAFGISAAYAGAAGALFAIATTFVNPDTFPVTLSIFLLVGVVVAGLGSLTGLIAGAIFIQFLPLWAQNVSKSPGAPAVVYGVILILVILALPAGAAGLVARVVRLARRGRSSEALTLRGYHRSRYLDSRDPHFPKEIPTMTGSWRSRALRSSRRSRSASRRRIAGTTPAAPMTRVSRRRRSCSVGTAPLSGPASAYASVARGADAYFKYVDAKGGVNRAQDHLQVRRRRLQPGAERPGDAPARRAGQGLRGLQLARHRAEPRRSRRT